MPEVQVPNYNVTVRPEGVKVVTVETGRMGPPGPQGPVGPQGIEGPRGEPGSGVSIYGALSSVAELPEDPAADEAYLIGGELYVYHDGSWTNAGSIEGPPGPEGPQGPIGPEGPAGPEHTFFYVHTQDNPSVVWTINHNLAGYPSTTVVDSGGTVVEGDVEYLNNSTVEVRFDGAFAGYAYLS